MVGAGASLRCHFTPPSIIFSQVRTYIRKTPAAAYSEGDFSAAVKRVHHRDPKQRMNVTQAAAAYGIPASTLRRYITASRLPVGRGRRPRLTRAQESKIVESCISLANLFVGVTHKAARTAAYQIAAAEAKKNRTANPFGTGVTMASYEWYRYGLRKRWPRLAERLPEATSINRVCAMTVQETGLFYDNLEIVYDRLRPQDKDVWNVDETGNLSRRHCMSCIYV
eukprot:GHVU01118486.1.p1 GENE.GHVU01118486.1~~GHVU01118486.1.p1  ORF type:complete len:224 (+),score=17.03 GHVU01118486.1:588-1259(+)